MRKKTLSISWLIVLLVAVLLLIMYSIPAYIASSRIHEVEWLAGLPCMDVQDAHDGPARFTGRLIGPENRVTPLGQKAAAYWWTVSSRDNDVGYDVKCHDEVRAGLVLVTGDRSIPITWANADPDDVGLASTYNNGQYGRPFAIDIGDAPAVLYQSIPAGICKYGENYLQTFIEQGARVEVVGCIRNGAIGRCDAILGGVVSVPDIRSDMRHRLKSARQAFLIPNLLALWLLGLATAAMWKWSMYSVRKIEQGNTGPL